MSNRYDRCVCAMWVAAIVATMGRAWPCLAQTPAAATQVAATQAESSTPVKASLPDQWVKAFTWRSIGPANMGGRITAIAVNEADPSMYWVATASGGLLKTVNNGFTYEHQFDREATVSIGDVAVAPSDPNIVWIGTGEANPRNSSSWGDGVYKSTDGGKSWKNMGLRKCFQTGQIAIHPTNPDIVYVGALGRLWGSNEERGLFKTVDGGANWEKVLWVDDKTGVIDVQLQPGNPDVLLAATYERQRDGFDTNDPAKKFGPGSAMWKSTDAGKTWRKITQGLPACQLGRIGLCWYRKDPNIVYAIVESERIGQEPENAPFAGITGEDAQVGARITAISEGGPAERAGLKVDDIVIRINDVAIHSYEGMQAAMRSHLAGDTVHVEVSRERKTFKVDLTFDKRPEEREDQPQPPAGEGSPESPGESEGEPSDASARESEASPAVAATSRPAESQPAGTQPASQPATQAATQPARPARTPFSSGLGGQRENVHEQQGPNGHDYGGVYMSTDAGETWTRINSVNPRPMYFSEIRVDPSDNKYIYVLGISLYKSEDGGKEFTAGAEGEAHVDHHALWIDPRDGRHMILGNDGGIYVTHDRMAGWDHHNHVAIGQFYHVAVDTRENYRVYGGLQDNGSWGGPMRVRNGPGPINEDWASIGFGDGFLCAVDPLDPDTVFFASQNGGLGSRNVRTNQTTSIRPRGQRGVRYRWNWESPYLLSAHNSRVYYTAANVVFRSMDRGQELKAISTEITRTDKGSATSLAESPRDHEVLYVGTDDGALWMTRNGGHDWLDLFDAQAVERAAETATRPERRRRGGSPAGAAGAPTEQRGSQGSPEGRGRRRGQGGGGGRGEGGGREGAGFDPDMLRQMDANGNGSLQRGELPERLQPMFERLDANGDGSIDQNELDAAAERMRQRGGGLNPPGQPPSEVEDQPATQPTTQPSPEAATQPSTPPTEPAGTQPQGGPAAEAGAGVASATAPADPITGIWEGRILRDDLPEGAGAFTFTLRMERDGRIRGVINTRFSDGDLTGTFNAATGRLRMQYGDDQRTVEYNATLGSDGRLTGESTTNTGRPPSKFEASRTSADPDAADGAPAAPSRGKPISELLPGPRWVSSLEASRASPGRVYVTFDGHRSNDDEPYVFVSEDHGRHWISIRGNLPTSAGSVKCLREDIANPDILYLGTEFGAWASIDRGASWTRFHNNLPTVAVHDFAQHRTCGDLIAATHGRSLWVVNVTPLRQLAAASNGERAMLFKPAPATYWQSEPSRAGTLRRFVGENPARDAVIYYSLSRPAQRLWLRVASLDGLVIREFEPVNQAGLHRVDWDLRRAPAPGTGGGPGGNRGGRRATLVPTGTYRVTLGVDDQTYSQDLIVQTDPERPDFQPWITEELELEVAREFMESEEAEATTRQWD